MQYTSPQVYEYISKNTNDTIIEWKTCRVSGTQFPVYQSDLDFYTKISHSLPSLEGGVGGGLTWMDKEYPVNIPEGTETIEAGLLASDITTVDDDILKKAILCEISGKPYRIIKPELEFYRKHTIPLPRKHPYIRHSERIKLRPGRALFLRCCDKCGEEMMSVYQISPNPSNSPQPSFIKEGGIQRGEQEHQQKVYCETCYQKEVYG